MHGKFAIAIALSVLGITASACSDANIGSNVDDVVNAKYAEGSAEARAILAVANDKVIDEEIARIINERYAACKALLSEKRETIEK